MIKTADSHVDHGLSAAQLEHILSRYSGRDSFFIDTFELPEELGTVPCALYGPAVGDVPVEVKDVLYAKRGDRAYLSRTVARALRPTRTVTVIAGPHGEHACIIYTAFGGPLAPKEMDDPTLGDNDRVKSTLFWTEHALATGEV